MTHSPVDAGSASRDGVARISREELQAALRSAEPPALFEVLPRGYWRKHHLPGARNAPPDGAATLIAAAVPDRAAPIVVYCWDPG